MADADGASTVATSSVQGEEENHDNGGDQRGVNVWGVVSIGVFYLAVLAVGIWAGWRQKRRAKAHVGEGKQAEVMLANRELGLVVGTLTTAATWVGGGFINGSAQAAYVSGLVWVQAPFGYAVALVISGAFFARPMRDARYTTMIDPFTQRYGRWGALQAAVAASAEILWSAAILNALGSTLQVILALNKVEAIVSSALIAVAYTLVGGLISVAYTDVFQLGFIAFGLVLALPFAATNPLVKSLDFGTTDWAGEVKPHHLGLYLDLWFLLLFGGVPWQAYFQRVLSSKSSARAVWMSYGGCVIAILMAIPSLLYGAVAKATDWSQTGFGHTPEGDDESSLVLPLCLQYLTPPVVAFFGLGAVSAAVMSSTDSSMLSASSMMTRNVYKVVFRPNASDRETLYVLWIFILANASIATITAITYSNVYQLFVLCGDIVYVQVFPQLVLVLFFERANIYGSVSSFIVGFALRLACGDEYMGFPGLIPVKLIPSWESDCGDDCWGDIPFRTMVMLVVFLVHYLVSTATYIAFVERGLSLNYDFMENYKRTNTGEVVVWRDRFLDDDDKDKNEFGLSKMPPVSRQISIPRPKTSNSYDNAAFQ